MQKVVDRSNKRIDETADFCPIVIGHTSRDPRNPKPPKIGWAGPFRLGWLNKDKKKLAVLCDFRIEQDKACLLKEYPRRSAELWSANGNYDEMYFDPISLLGAETPWSDMGVLLYQKEENGEKVWYAAEAPSAFNVFVPDGKGNKEKYSMENDEIKLSNEQQAFAQTILNAIFQSPEFKFLQQLREERFNEKENGPDFNVPEEPIAETFEEEDVVEPEVENAEVDAELPEENGEDLNDVIDESDFEDLDNAPPVEEGPDGAISEPDLEEAEIEEELDETDDEDGEFEDEAFEDDDEEDGIEDEEEYEEETDYLDERGGNDSMSIEKLARENAELKERLARLEELVVMDRGRNIDVQRYSKLESLSQRFFFDKEEEFEKCKYAKMNDEEFNEHCAVIEKNYRSRPDFIDIPSEVLGGAGYSRNVPGAVQYSKEQAIDIEKKFVEAYENNARRGVYENSEALRNRITQEVLGK